MKFLIVEPSPLSSLLGPNIRLRILFSNTLSLDSSLNVRDHVSQPYITTGNIIVLYFYEYLVTIILNLNLNLEQKNFVDVIELLNITSLLTVIE